MWPLQGLLHFLAHPRWWFAPVVTAIMGWALVFGAGIGVFLWQKPESAQLDFSTPWAAAGTLWAFTRALGLAATASLGAYLILLPLLMALAMDGLARAVQRAQGAPPAAEEPLGKSLASALRVILNTLPLRLTWLGLSLVAGLVGGPFGMLIGALGIAHVGALDACDVALAVRGIDGLTRVRTLKAHRDEILGGAVTATPMAALLGATLIGMAFWTPALVTGAARKVLDWDEVKRPLLPVAPVTAVTAPTPAAPPPPA